MFVANITIQDYTTSGTTYTYHDKSGAYEYILIQDASGKALLIPAAQLLEEATQQQILKVKVLRCCLQARRYPPVPRNPQAPLAQ